MRCEKLVSQRTGALQRPVRVVTERAEKRRQREEVEERHRQRIEMRTPPRLLVNPEPEYPWEPPHQRESVKVGHIPTASQSPLGKECSNLRGRRSQSFWLSVLYIGSIVNVPIQSMLTEELTVPL